MTRDHHIERKTKKRRTCKMVAIQFFFKRFFYNLSQFFSKCKDRTALDEWIDKRREKKRQKQAEERREAATIVVDSSILLSEDNDEEMERLGRFVHVVVPVAVIEQLSFLSRKYGENPKRVHDLVMEKCRQGCWDIEGSHGSGIIKKISSITLDKLEEETIQEIEKKTKAKFDRSYIRIDSKDVLGFRNSLKLRVLATAMLLKQKQKDIVLLTADRRMLAVAKDNIISLTAVNTLEDLLP